MPSPRDDHAMIKLDNKTIAIFGGFVEGERVNEVYSLDVTTCEWIYHKSTDKAPVPRVAISAHSYNGKMYIFGGADEENDKLNDFWGFDF